MGQRGAVRTGNWPERTRQGRNFRFVAVSEVLIKERERPINELALKSRAHIGPRRIKRDNSDPLASSN